MNLPGLFSKLASHSKIRANKYFNKANNTALLLFDHFHPMITQAL